MPCTNCVEKEQYDKIVEERDELKHRCSREHAKFIETWAFLQERNAILQVLYLATGLSDDMLRELFGDIAVPMVFRQYSADAVARKVQHCINTNATVIDTTTGFSFDIAERLQRAIAARNVYGEEAEGKEAKPNARCRKTKKKRDVRAKPEQSQRRAKRGKAKLHQKGK